MTFKKGVGYNSASHIFFVIVEHRNVKAVIAMKPRRVVLAVLVLTGSWVLEPPCRDLALVGKAGAVLQCGVAIPCEVPGTKCVPAPSSVTVVAVDTRQTGILETTGGHCGFRYVFGLFPIACGPSPMSGLCKAGPPV